MLVNALPILAAGLPLVVAVSTGYLQLDVTKRSAFTPSLIRRQQSFGADVTQNNGLEYLINITVGTPPQSLAVTIDTGSSDLWIPAVSSQPCREGNCDGGSLDPEQSSSYNVIEEGGFNITYAGPGDSDAGDWVQETITVGGSRSIENVILGVALDGADQHGVMGVGFDTNEAEPNPSRNGSYQSVLDHMAGEGVINRKAYSLYLNDLNETTGSICFGCVDTAKYSGDLVALPLQAPPEGAELPTDYNPNAFFVTISDVTFIDAAGMETTLSPDGYAQSALLDSGTSQTLITNDVLTSLANGLGAVFVEQEQIFAVPCSYGNSNASIRYTFGGEDGPSVTVPISEMIFGEAIAPADYPGHSGGACNLGVSGPIDGSVILGDTFLRNAYVVYDLDNYQVAIAQARGGQGGTSSIQVIPTGTSIPGVSSTASATGTQLDDAQATAEATGIAVATGSKATAGTPTFQLGASATASNAQASGSSEPSSGPAAMVVAAPQAVLFGAAGVLAGAFLL